MKFPLQIEDYNSIIIPFHFIFFLVTSDELESIIKKSLLIKKRVREIFSLLVSALEEQVFQHVIFSTTGHEPVDLVLVEFYWNLRPTERGFYATSS